MCYYFLLFSLRTIINTYACHLRTGIRNNCLYRFIKTKAFLGLLFPRPFSVSVSNMWVALCGPLKISLQTPSLTTAAGPGSDPGRLQKQTNPDASKVPENAATSATLNWGGGVEAACTESQPSKQTCKLGKLVPAGPEKEQPMGSLGWASEILR